MLTLSALFICFLFSFFPISVLSLFFPYYFFTMLLTEYCLLKKLLVQQQPMFYVIILSDFRIIQLYQNLNGLHFKTVQPILRCVGRNPYFCFYLFVCFFLDLKCPESTDNRVEIRLSGLIFSLYCYLLFPLFLHFFGAQFPHL